MKIFVTALMIALIGPSGAFAGSLPMPDGDVILTITGNIKNTNQADSADFDMAMLDAAPGRKAEMETPWTKGRTAFEGPFLRNLLDQVGAHGRTLRIKALNDYSSDVPIQDAMSLDTILAIRMNGEPMSVREKGPIFMIYPFDLRPDIYNEKYFSRSVWQIREIEVVE